ncbi:short-chain dehydrogenase/reductase SDR [Cristinia sonorae]|uniref:Short-chain dehydrogenase/reductase SDR n=1 Tax=Cristinia sonorae TaxID=1940300 RepID=A0A8K0UPT5_9AGAR|nr:short-chain dehydrogenase/reductase SDR [Cristinia sonorae]
MAERLSQVAGHLSNAHGRGLLAGEVAIITGSGQGIGRSCAILFAKEGAKVVVSDLDVKKAEAVVDEITAAGGDAIAVGGDVGADDFPQRILDATIKKYGKLNHIVNNAGFTFDRMLHTTPDDAFDIIIKVHVRAPFRLIRAAAPYMRIKGNTENRSVVNVSSTSGLHGNVGQANYAAAKSAVIGLTKTLCKEWGVFGVRANTVAFGHIVTRLTLAKEDGASIEIDGKKVALGIPGAKSAKDASAVAQSNPLVPLGRPGTPDEAAASILFLASPLAAYVSGHTLEVTGGAGI